MKNVMPIQDSSRPVSSAQKQTQAAVQPYSPIINTSRAVLNFAESMQQADGFKAPKNDTTGSKSTNSKTTNSKPIRRVGQALLTTSLAMIISLTASFTQMPSAQAASLADLFGGNNTISAQKKFLKVEDAFSVNPVQNGNRIDITLNITPKHYLYKDKLTLKLPEGVSATDFQFSHTSEAIDDPTFGKVDVFRQPTVTATALLTNTTGKPIDQDIKVTWQGCADAGLCYPPQNEILAISLPASTMTATQTDEVGVLDEVKVLDKVKVGGVSNTNNTSQTQSKVEQTFEQAISSGQDKQGTQQDKQDSQSGLFNNAGLINEDPFGLTKHPWLAMLLLFLAGLGLAFTPCVLPMLPIVSNIVARQHTPTAKKGLILSGSYALGVAVAYGILGAVIAVFGQQLGIIGWLQNPVILLSFAAVFVLLALYMLDVVRIPVPNSLRQKSQALSQAGDKYLGNSAGSFVAGLLSALVVSPCVSAPLFGALLAVSTIGNPLLGFAALFMLGFGLSAPLILLGIGQSNLMPKAGEWMVWVKQGFALLLFAVALLLIERVLISPIMLMLWSVWFMVIATWAWCWQGRGQLFTRSMAAILAIWSGLTLIGAAAGSQDSWQPLRVFVQPQVASIKSQQALSANPALANPPAPVDDPAAIPGSNMASSFSAEGTKDLHLLTLESLIPVIENNDKVLVDLTAEWCIECRVMDKTLFTNRPQELQQWQIVRLDITETNADSARILSELRLFGPPALLYFVDGKLVEQQVGVIGRHEFEATLARL